MPYGDRTGPNGFGSRTGRGAGFCNGFNAPGYANRGNGGFGYGRGGGYGRGRGNNTLWNAGFHFVRNLFQTPQPPQSYQPNYYPEDELNILKEQLNQLTDASKQIQNRIEQLESKERNTPKE